MDELYGKDCTACGGFRDEASVGIVFDAGVLDRMLREIYDGMDVRGSIQRDAFLETLRLFNGAAAEGLSQADYRDYDDLFLEQIRTNNEVFSAFRVHRMQNDMASRLLDGDGRLKPFDRWVEDIRDISSHYVVRWLRTEYNTAVLRARQAAEWKGFRAEQDVLPNLRWMPTTSPEPDNLHRQYWQARLTLPVGHPFWEQHRPGDRWNCKCSLRQTDEPATAGAVADFKPVPPVPGLDGNPADDGKLFSDSHPYFTQAYPGAEKATENTVRQRAKDLLGKQRDELKGKSRSLVNTVLRNETFGKDVSVSMSGIKEWLNQPHKWIMEKNAMLPEIERILAESEYLGYGPDKHDPEIKMHLFETKVHGEKSWIIVRELIDGSVKLHSISDSEDITKHLTHKKRRR